MTSPEILSVKRQAGVAGHYQFKALVRYPDEAPHWTTFVGSVYGPPIVMVLPSGNQVFVSARVRDRIGTKLSEAWVRAFFSERS